MTQPLVSIIIPVAAAHARHVATAVASCRWQTIPDWEAVIVNDTGQPLASRGDARVTVIDAPPTAGNRASSARNAGLEVASGLFTIFLDADDYLLSGAIATFLRGHARHEAAYSYGGHYGLNQQGVWAQYRPPDWEACPSAEAEARRTRGQQVQTLQEINLHPISAFVPTWCVREVGGFDEAAPGLEDWTLWIRLAMAGYCGARIFGPTFVYRRDEGINHGPDAAQGRTLMDAVTAPYRDSKGVMAMAGCGCGGGARNAKDTARQIVGAFGAVPADDNGMVMLEFTGRSSGTQNFRHPRSGREYRAGGLPSNKYIRVAPEDVPYLTEELRFFVRVQPPAAFEPPPAVTGADVAESHAAAPLNKKREKVTA